MGYWTGGKIMLSVNKPTLTTPVIPVTAVDTTPP
jgi:hypothetical protein